jgi:hypothetical protein
LHRYLAFIALFCVLVITSAAHASTITEIISFTATGDIAASGSYTLTFDPTASYFDVAAGLTTNSLSLTFGTAVPVGFDYIPTSDNSGELIIGGLLSSVSGAAGGTDDYILLITGLNTTPVFDNLVISSTGDPRDVLTDTTGTVSVTAVAQPPAVPEPDSIALLGTGLVVLFSVARRRLA